MRQLSSSCFVVFFSSILLFSGCQPGTSVGEPDSEELNVSDRVSLRGTYDRSEAFGNLIDDADPENVLRRFMIATIFGDIEMLEQTALSNEQLALLADNFLSPAQRTAAAKQLNIVPIVRLEVGDSFEMPNGDEYVVDESMSNETKQLFNFPGNPIPFELVLNEEAWRVNAAPLIAIRKTANELRNQDRK